MPSAPPRRVSLDAQLRRIERHGGGGTIHTPSGADLDVSNLDKLYFPQDGVTKGAVMRYYGRIAPVLLPLIAARPLALNRYPNGIAGKSFYQQSPGESVPEGVRTALVPIEGGRKAPRLVGGDLVTLLYCVQLGAIAVHPWHSRLSALAEPDYCVLDLDPGTEAGFRGAVQVARIIREFLVRWRLRAAVKTSGATGIHIAVPLPAGTTYGESTEFAQDLATRIADRHPELATVERRLTDRPPSTVYIDFQQNSQGKTTASAFSLRARRGAPVSWPLSWAELLGGPVERATLGTVTRAASAEAAGRWTAVLKRRNVRPAFAAAG